MHKQFLVLLPGYDGNSHTFDAICPALEKKFSVVCLDFPFINSSEKSFTLDQLAQYVHENTQIMDRFHLVGFSMGGMVATRYTEMYPGKVKSLTLISSTVRLATHMHENPLVRLGLLISQSRVLSNSFAFVYSAKFLKFLLHHSPLPIPRVAIPASQGYSYFGTLGHVIRDTTQHEYVRKLTSLSVPRSAFLCEDDMSFPAHDYAPLLQKYGFKTVVHEKGGHATGNSYWQDVTEFLFRTLPRS